MKINILVAFLFFLSTVSCNTSTQENAAQQEQVADTLKQAPAAEAGEMESEHHEEEGAAPLSLNNGMKWKADDVTNQNVKTIRKVVSEFESKPNPALHDYHNAANKISEATNKLIADCKMTGPEHEALHQWLLPLIADTNKLLDTTDANDASKVFSEIKEWLNMYNHYFD
jgi:hypothetical protein